MSLIQGLRELWWARQRATDMRILWPICKERALSLEHAKAAFACHAFNDPCWIRFYGEQKLIRIIGELQ